MVHVSQQLRYVRLQLYMCCFSCYVGFSCYADGKLIEADLIETDVIETDLFETDLFG
jgi:hypothetical protein